MAGEWYKKFTPGIIEYNPIMFISSMIFTLIAGVLSLSYSFSPQNLLFAQISKTSSLSEVNPLGSIGNVTLPLDKIWEALKAQFNGYNPTEDIKRSVASDISPGASKSALEEIFEGKLQNVSLWQALGIVKSAFIVGANVLVAVMEIAIKVLRFVLGLIT